MSKLEDEIRRDCMIAMVDLLGGGYTKEYYSSAASDFVGIAMAYYEQGLKDAVKLADSYTEKVGA